jgi:hypothetical protein
MRLMREATKRVLRLTPFVSFQSLGDVEVRLVVSDIFDAAATGIGGRSIALPTRTGDRRDSPSEQVTSVAIMSITDSADETTEGRRSKRDFADVAEAALDIARRTGQVTNQSLREVAPITSEEARVVFSSLIEQGSLVRRGAARGTHYVLPDAGPPLGEEPPSDDPPPPSPLPAAPPSPSPFPSPPSAAVDRRAKESALRRLIRRGRT